MWGRKKKIRRDESGWLSYFDPGCECQYRRYTILSLGDLCIKVFTARTDDMLGFETRAMHAGKKYYNTGKPEAISFDSPWHIKEPNEFDEADNMHKAVVTEISERMLRGEYKENQY